MTSGRSSGVTLDSGGLREALLFLFQVVENMGSHHPDEDCNAPAYFTFEVSWEVANKGRCLSYLKIYATGAHNREDGRELSCAMYYNCVLRDFAT